MRLLRRFRSPFAARRALRALERIEAHLGVQNALLQRLADQFAPAFEESAETAARTTGVDHLNEREAVTVLEYVARTERETGKTPTEDEILRYLADEATTSLQDRLEQGR